MGGSIREEVLVPGPPVGPTQTVQLSWVSDKRKRPIRNLHLFYFVGDN